MEDLGKYSGTQNFWPECRPLSGAALLNLCMCTSLDLHGCVRIQLHVCVYIYITQLSSDRYADMRYVHIDAQPFTLGGRGCVAEVLLSG